MFLPYKFILALHGHAVYLLPIFADLVLFIIGESQILVQVKQSYKRGIVSRLLNGTVTAEKRFRSKTSIFTGAAYVPMQICRLKCIGCLIFL